MVEHCLDCPEDAHRFDAPSVTSARATVGLTARTIAPCIPGAGQLEHPVRPYRVEVAAEQQRPPARRLAAADGDAGSARRRLVPAMLVSFPLAFHSEMYGALVALPIAGGVIAAGLLGFASYRYMFRDALRKAIKELDGLLIAIDSDLRSVDVFGAAPSRTFPRARSDDNPGGPGGLLS